LKFTVSFHFHLTHLLFFLPDLRGVQRQHSVCQTQEKGSIPLFIIQLSSTKNYCLPFLSLSFCFPIPLDNLSQATAASNSAAAVESNDDDSDVPKVLDHVHLQHRTYSRHLKKNCYKYALPLSLPPSPL
jgi:hypothetical protein